MENIIDMKKPYGYWNKENIIKAISECATYNELTTKYRNAYNAAQRLGILDEVTSGLKRTPRPYKSIPKGYWDEEKIIEHASKCETLSDFIENHNNAYSAAQKLGILDEVTSHLSRNQKPAGYWTKKRIIESVSECKTMTEFIKNHIVAYRTAQKLGIL